jgi:hypothetical protein
MSIAKSATERPSAFICRGWPKCPKKNRSKNALAAVRGGNETILLVEDDAPARLRAQSLSQLGYRVLEAATASKPWKSGNNTAMKSICC